MKGDVLVQTGLSPECPFSTAVKVAGPCVGGDMVPVVKVKCRSGVVWALSQNGKLHARTGIQDGKPKGVGWQEVLS